MLTRAGRQQEDDPNAASWEEIWFNAKTGEVECVGEGWGESHPEYFSPDFEMLEIDYNRYLGYTVKDKMN